METKLYSEQYAKDLLDIYSYYVTDSVFTFDLVVPSLAQFNTKLLACHVCLIGLEEGRVIGFAFASAHRAKAAYDTVCETTIYMDSNYRSAGHGTKLYAGLLNVLRTLGYYTALGGITEPNAGSEGLHQKLGFQKGIRYENIGYKDGAWRNVNWWRKDLLPFEGPPKPLLKITDLSTEELGAILS
jgi:phosphinothricin acetyltransferase